MRIYFDGGESERERRRRERLGERAARAAFVNDECVVVRDGKLRGTRVRKGGSTRARARAGLSCEKKEREKKSVRALSRTPSLLLILANLVGIPVRT